MGLTTAWTVLHDGWRSLRAAPGATVFALLILALGIAAATVTFSVVDAVILRSLPFADQDRLVLVTPEDPEAFPVYSYPLFDAWRKGADAFAELAATTVGPIAHVPMATGVEKVRSWQTTGSLFDVLGVRPLLGRLFTADNEVAGQDAVAVISYGLWQHGFGGDPDVVGRSIRLADSRDSDVVARVVEIIGVMPAGFTYPMDIGPSLWIPHVAGAARSTAGRNAGGSLRASGYLTVIGRLRDDVSFGQARAQLEGIRAARAAADGLTLREGTRPTVVPFYDTLVGNIRGWMLLVLWAVSLVMLVACANVANLMLARSADRARELAVRSSLGASPRRLGASLLAESLMLSLAAAALGITLAFWGVGVATAALPGGIPRADQIVLDFRVLVVAVSAAVAAGLMSGAVPAWHVARGGLGPLLREGGATMTESGRRWRAGFVVAEVALAGTLLVASTLFVASFVRAVRADLGFVRSGLLTVALDDDGGRTEAIVAAVRSTPGVASVGAVAGTPPLVMAAFGGSRASLSLQAYDPPDNGVRLASVLYRVSPGYFDTAGIRLIRGRTFTPGDDAGAVAIIDELAASVLFSDGREPIGARVTTDGSPLTIVGVVSTVSPDGPEQASGTQLYLPRRLGSGGAAQLVVRTSRRASDVAPAIRRSLASVLPSGAAVPEVRSIEDAFRRITAGRRASASLMAAFGLVVLFIGAAGVYAVMASVVAQQRRELGVHIALGATPGRIAARMLRQAGSYLLGGLGVGLLAGGALSRVFASLLFEVRPMDLDVYLVVSVLLSGSALAAALVPARRAGRVDPLKMLREE